MSCSLCSPCFRCGSMKYLKQENKKVNTSAPSMLESFTFHILQYQDFLFGTFFLFAISPDILQLQKERCHILFSSKLQNQRISEKNVKLTCKRGLKLFPHKRESIVTFERLFFLGLKVFTSDLHL